MKPADQVTVCVLLYGDHCTLAHRCLDSIVRAFPSEVALRVGLNAVGRQTRDYVLALVDGGRIDPLAVYDAGENIHKYPMMRWMFYGGHLGRPPVDTTYVMWFDDDSYVRPEAERWRPGVLDRAVARMERDDSPAMLGSIYTIPLAASQRVWISEQPWYTGVEIGPRASFAQGAWWLARLAFLKEHDYPWPSLDHNGGDVMLGALCRQQGRAIARFKDGMAINADWSGRESSAGRRGFSQPPIGVIEPEPWQPPHPLTPPKRRLYSNLDL